MAHIHKEIAVNASPEHVWEAVRDVGAVHERLARGFVAKTRLDGDVREVTFGNGAVVSERILDIDESARRVTYSIVGGRPTAHPVHPGGRRRKRQQHDRLAHGCAPRRSGRAVRRHDGPGLRRDEQYDVYFNADESESVVIERFRDSDALIQHSANLGDEFMAAVLATGTVTGELLGEPSPELKAMLGDSPPQLFTPYISL